MGIVALRAALHWIVRHRIDLRLRNLDAARLIGEIAGIGQFAKQAGRRIVDLVREDLRPAQIMTRAGLENMIRVLHAIGGSTNAVLHILALAQELDLGELITLEVIERLSQEQHCIVAVRPSGPYTFVDMHLEIPRSASFEQAHEITVRAKAIVRRLVDRSDVIIHTDPMVQNQESISESMEKHRGRNISVF